MDVKFLEVMERVSSLEEGATIPESVWAAATDIVKDYMLGKQSYGEDRPPEDKDFTEHRSKCFTGLKWLQAFFKKLEGLCKSVCNKNFVVSAVLLCGEHNSISLWTTPECVETSVDCLQSLVRLCKCKSISDLLTNRNIPDMFRSLLLVLRPKLLKETWRLYPAAVHCYCWLLLHVKSPHLSEHLGNVLPTALIIVDDHIVSNRILGINSVTHIIQNVTRTELCSQGWDNVLYHTLKPLLLQREPELIKPVYTCMSTLLASTEQGYTRSVGPGEWSRLESTLLVLVHNMECEDRLVLRSAYAQSLEPILQAMGASVIQLSKKLLRVFEEYLAMETPDTRHYALLAFNIFVHNSQVRLASNGEKITYLLLRTLYDLTKAMNECDNCAKNMVVLQERVLREETAKNDVCDDVFCFEHHWTDDLRIVIDCFRFVKLCLPLQFGTLREDFTTKLTFNPFLTTIIQHLFNVPEGEKKSV